MEKVWGFEMQGSGESEYSSENGKPVGLKLFFWQSFLLTLAGAAGLISMVANGPTWLTYAGLVSTVALLIWVIVTRKKKEPKQD